MDTITSLLKQVKSEGNKVQCAFIEWNDFYFDQSHNGTIHLCENYSLAQAMEWYNALIKLNTNSSSIIIKAIIWISDGSFIRYSNKWELIKTPDIPKILKSPCRL